MATRTIFSHDRSLVREGGVWRELRPGEPLTTTILAGCDVIPNGEGRGNLDDRFAYIGNTKWEVGPITEAALRESGFGRFLVEAVPESRGERMIAYPDSKVRRDEFDALVERVAALEAKQRKRPTAA